MFSVGRLVGCRRVVVDTFVRCSNFSIQYAMPRKDAESCFSRISIQSRSDYSRTKLLRYSLIRTHAGMSVMLRRKSNLCYEFMLRVHNVNNAQGRLLKMMSKKQPVYAQSSARIVDMSLRRGRFQRGHGDFVDVDGVRCNPNKRTRDGSRSR